MMAGFLSTGRDTPISPGLIISDLACRCSSGSSSPISSSPDDNHVSHDQEDDEVELDVDNTEETTVSTSNKRRGRGKIGLKLIEQRQKRNATFHKRKSGLMKKGFELSMLTGAEIMILASIENNIFSYSTKKLQKFLVSRQGQDLVQKALKGTLEVDTPAEVGDVQDKTTPDGGLVRKQKLEQATPLKDTITWNSGKIIKHVTLSPTKGVLTKASDMKQQQPCRRTRPSSGSNKFYFVESDCDRDDSSSTVDHGYLTAESDSATTPIKSGPSSPHATSREIQLRAILHKANERGNSPPIGQSVSQSVVTTHLTAQPTQHQQQEQPPQHNKSLQPQKQQQQQALVQQQQLQQQRQQQQQKQQQQQQQHMSQYGGLRTTGTIVQQMPSAVGQTAAGSPSALPLYIPPGYSLVASGSVPPGVTTGTPTGPPMLKAATMPNGIPVYQTYQPPANVHYICMPPQHQQQQQWQQQQQQWQQQQQQQ
eukprot:scpid93192/ scgid29923/ Serum response factor